MFLLHLYSNVIFFSEESNDTLVQRGTIIMRTVLTSKDRAQYQSNSLMYAIIGLSVAAVLIVIAYVLIYICQLLTSERQIPTRTV